MTPDTLFSQRVWGSRLGTQQTPIVDDVKDENPVQLDPEQISKYRSHVARDLFFSQDRADITFAVNELCRKMSHPTQHSFCRVETTRPVLEGRAAMTSSFKFGDMSSEVTFSDSDWARDRNEEIVKHGCCARGTTPFESAYKKTESSPEAVQKQSCMQQHWERQKQRVSRARSVIWVL